MKSAAERHFRFFLAHTRDHPGDWEWFDREWPQISQRIWNKLAENEENSALILTLITAVHNFQMKRGLWAEGLIWKAQNE